MTSNSHRVLKVYTRLRRYLAPLAIYLRRVPGLRWAVSAIEGRVLPDKPIEVGTIDGFRIFVDARDHAVARALISDGTWQRAEADVIRRVLAPGDVAVDVGANVGYLTGIMADAVGRSGRVYAFEPEPTNYAMLQRTIDANGWTQVRHHNVALGRGRSELSLKIDPSNWGNHSLASDADRSGASVTVQVDSLDQLLADADLRRLKLIKVDVQGWEEHVLAGAQAAHGVKPMLLIEFYPIALREAGSDPREFLHSLYGWGPVRLMHERSRQLYQATPTQVFDACAESVHRQVDLLIGDHPRI
ncbi:MAG: FkbM family methyltransferase [Jatrophihabitans sp.]